MSLSSLITNAELRKSFRQAEQSSEREEYKESIAYSDDVFCKAIFDIADVFSKAGVLTVYFKGGDELGEIIKDGYAGKHNNNQPIAISS
ncbi:MAG: hypothetical protein NTV77_03510 [Candidatus Azambacteria bacterium]|nr:hypothetical protein [Candidatus Azambacteria bacterium]